MIDKVTELEKQSTNQSDCQIHDVPDLFLEKWQCTIDTMTSIFEVPAGLIMRVLQNEIEVLVSSHTENNPYAANERAPLKTGLYCETVMASQAMLHVPNALEDDHWKNSPDIALNMVSYLGIPLFWKEKEIFGTISVLDRTTRNFPKKYIDVLWELKKLIESDFLIIQQQKEISSQDKEIKRILHDRRVHQIDLEAQNEELHQAQAELKAAQARYFDLYDLAPVGYCTLSEQGLILEANSTAATLLGLARGDLFQQPLARFILKEDREIFYGIRKQFLITGAASSGKTDAVQAFELRMLRQGDGTTFWAHLEAAVLAPATGETKAETTQLRIVLSDVTERKQKEEELRESESRYQRIVTTVPAMLYDYLLYPDGSSRFLYVSPNCYDILELDDKELLSDMNLFWKMIHSDDIERLHEEDIAANLAGRIFKTEVRLITKSERIKWVQLSSRPNPAPPGEPAIWSGYILDITARKQMEEALEDELRRLQQALDEVRTLRGIIPICSYCKKIRDDEGYWNQVEKYVSDHSEAKFSHGICPACFEREMKILT